MGEDAVARPRATYLSGNSLGPAVQRQQFAQNLVVGDVRRPTVRGGHGRVKGFVSVGEPLRPGVL